jgi:hypothetical protein
MSEIDDLEQPPENAAEGDAAEQRAPLDENGEPGEDRQPGGAGPLPEDANEADATEQRVEVRLDEDDYR